MTQLKRKFIEDNAINGAKLRLDNNQPMRARNAAGDGDIEIMKVTTADVLEFLQLPQAEEGLPVPSNPKQFATLEYIENYLMGKTDAKDSVSYLADADIGGTFSAGDSVTPASITGTSALTIDGKTFGAGDVNARPLRIGIVGQTDAAENGIYDLTAADGSSFTLTRSADFDGLDDPNGSEVTSGAYFRVIAGTVYSGYEVMLVSEDPLTVNVSDLNFVKYPTSLQIIAGDMLTKTGNTFSVNLAAISGLESDNPGDLNGKLRVKVDQAAAEQDQSTRLDGASGALVTTVAQRQSITLSATDITNQYVDLSHVAQRNSVEFVVAGGGQQIEGSDYAVNYTGGASSKTRLTFQGGLATSGVSELVEGDVVIVKYQAYA